LAKAAPSTAVIVSIAAQTPSLPSFIAEFLPNGAAILARRGPRVH
jgi:hypothetical protein